MDSLRNDLKTGWAVWKKTGDLRLSMIQMIIFVFISMIAVLFVKPIYIERITVIAGSRASIVFALVFLVHLVITAVMLRQIIKDSGEKNKYIFYQLTIAKKSAFMVTFLDNVGWYYYFMVFLFIITNIHNKFLPVVVIEGTIFYIFCFALHYRAVGREEKTANKGLVPPLPHSSICRNASLFRNHPNMELIAATVKGYYSCKNLVLSKICFIVILIFMGVSSSTHILNFRVFLLLNIFIILLNDGYWKQESRNFLCFSRLGIPIGKYICIQIVSGACFNMAISIVILMVFRNSLISTVFSILLLLYMECFWCFVQVYLWMTVGRGKELTVTQWSILFLIVGFIPVVNIFTMIWLFRRVKQKWMEA